MAHPAGEDLVGALGVKAVSSLAVLWSCVTCAPIAVEAFEERTPESLVTGGEGCPNELLKVAPGACGCGIPDDDLDGDGALDCVEDCPDNADRTFPMGPCGCSSFTDAATCTLLRDALRNLYTFDGTGTLVVDSVSGMHGTLLTGNELPTEDLTRLQVNGRLSLGGLGSYVDLPDGMISGLGSASFEMWMSSWDGAAWSRLFDFGSNMGAPEATGQTYLFLTPANGFTGVLRAAYSASGFAGETVADGPDPLPVSATAAGGAAQHVAVVIDAPASSLRLYSNGVEVSSVPLAGELAAIEDVNNWLGRSNYEVDPAFSGTLMEFRIYDRALSAAELGASFQAGPGALK